MPARHRVPRLPGEELLAESREDDRILDRGIGYGVNACRAGRNGARVVAIGTNPELSARLLLTYWFQLLAAGLAISFAR